MSEIDILYYVELAIILLVSIGLHEYAHAYVSYKFGDPTPQLQKRLTPNPLKHVDPVGFLMIFLVGFGRGKPVQINPTYYKNPRRDELFVALAGPFTNLALAIIGILAMLIYSKLVGIGTSEVMMGNFGLVGMFWMLFSLINISLAVFNMIPLPPLDGFRLVKMFAPRRALKIEKYSLYISLVFLALILFGPGKNLFGEFISGASDLIFRFFFSMFSWIFY